MVEERMSRAGWTYGQLVDDIFEGRWAAEETVSAYSLASRLGVSRTPVVEALKRLEAEGIVEIVPKVGCRLARRDPESLDELLSVAGALEGLAAERAAERADGAQLRRMGGVVDGLAEAAASDDGAAFAQLERQFHRQLTAAGLPRLDSAADGVWLSLRAALGPQVSRQSRQHIATGRRGILEALRLRDSARARAAAERHIAALAGDARNGAAGDCAALGNALGGLEHSALLYGSEAEFVASALPLRLPECRRVNAYWWSAASTTSMCSARPSAPMVPRWTSGNRRPGTPTRGLRCGDTSAISASTAPPRGFASSASRHGVTATRTRSGTGCATSRSSTSRWNWPLLRSCARTTPNG